MRKPSIKLLSSMALGLCIVSTYIQASTVTLSIPSLNVTADAEFVAGEKEKTAVLILHGFLTTHKFHTITSMSSALQDEGFTTLAPTLTLNISKRQHTVKCNSIHTHTLENDVEEIKSWVQWLHNKGYQKVVFLGHSSGSQQLLHSLVTENDTMNIKGAIFTSLFYLNGPELGVSKQDIQSAQKAIAEHINRPYKYSFLFCKNNYYAIPKSFSSYLKLDRQYVLDSLNQLTIPTYTIMGSEDKRYQSVGNNWLPELVKTKTKVIMIEGANHFFSSEHEFDLQDHITEIVNRF